MFSSENKLATTQVLQKRGGVCFYGSEVLNSSFVHLIKFSAENPRIRQALKRCVPYKFYQQAL
jgi:hypothetical protein